MFDTQKLLTPKESVLAQSGLHWILMVKGVLWFVVACICALYIPSIFWNNQTPDFSKGLDFIIFYTPLFVGADIYVQLVLASMIVIILAGLFICVFYIVKYISSILIITENRFIYKTGLVFIHIEEIEIDEIEEVHINTGVMGRFLNYANIHVDMRFVGEKLVSNVANPYYVINYLHRSHDQSEDKLAGITQRK